MPARFAHRVFKQTFFTFLAFGLLLGGAKLTFAGVAQPIEMSSFRVRGDFQAPLNSDAGWLADEAAVARVYADEPFRLRIEITGPQFAEDLQFGLQWRRNGGPWEEAEFFDFPLPEEDSPSASLVTAAAYAHRSLTADLLKGEGSPSVSGAAVSGETLAPIWSQPGPSSEWVWPLVIRRFADGPELNEAGDEFEFRMIEAITERPLKGTLPKVTLAVREGHLGGTFVETPGRIGPWQSSDGSLYFIMEPTETDNLFMMVKSTDGGKTWREADPSGRPPIGDLESVDARFDGKSIFIIHQTSIATWHYQFNTVDYPDGEGWAEPAQLISLHGEPPTQAASLAMRPEGSLVAFYSGPEEILISQKSKNGAWTPLKAVIPKEGVSYKAPKAISEGNGLIHFAFNATDGKARYGTLSGQGELSDYQVLSSSIAVEEEDASSVLPLAIEPLSEVLLFAYREQDGMLYERRLSKDGKLSPASQISGMPVVQNSVDSDQVGADLVSFPGGFAICFIDETSRSLYLTVSRQTGKWSKPRRVVGGIDASWVRGEVFKTQSGELIYRFVYDAGSQGGSGMNRYGEVTIKPFL